MIFSPSCIWDNQRQCKQPSGGIVSFLSRLASGKQSFGFAYTHIDFMDFLFFFLCLGLRCTLSGADKWRIWQGAFCIFHVRGALVCFGCFFFFSTPKSAKIMSHTETTTGELKSQLPNNCKEKKKKVHSGVEQVLDFWFGHVSMATVSIWSRIK